MSGHLPSEPSEPGARTCPHSGCLPEPGGAEAPGPETRPPTHLGDYDQGGGGWSPPPVAWWTRVPSPQTPSAGSSIFCNDKT